MKVSFLEIICGVPQGTVLGPLLVNININDLYTSSQTGNITSFADDSAIISCHKLESELELANIFTWFNEKLLSVNYRKTHFVSFTSYAPNLPIF